MIRRASVLLLFVLALAGCGDEDGGGDYGTAPDGVEELGNLLDLRSAFEADQGKTRVLLLFSPT